MIAWARSPLAAAMVGKTIGHPIEENDLPIYIQRFGTTVDEIFVTAPDLRERYRDRSASCPSAPSATTPTTSASPRACDS